MGVLTNRIRCCILDSMIADMCHTEAAKAIAEDFEKRVKAELGQDPPTLQFLAMQCALLCELLATRSIIVDPLYGEINERS